MMQCLKELCSLEGVSGHEHPVRAYILQKLEESPVPKTVTVDALGNVIVALAGQKRAAKKVAFAAHMDEVGFMITGATSEGFLRFTTVGALSDTVVFGKRVLVGGRVGVIGGKAVHHCSVEEKTTAPKAETLYIDVGVDTKEEALAVARPGDAAVFLSEPLAMGSAVKARAIDDRSGCALLLELAKEQPLYDMTLVFTVQEEVGLRGAKTAAFSVAPDLAVIIDATTACDCAGVPEEKEVCRQRKGGVVSFMDRATVYDADLFRWITETCAKEGIPLQCKQAATGGNDAGAFQSAGSGVRVAAVSLPARYIHSPSSVVTEEDMQAMVAFLKVAAARLPEGTV